MIPTLVALAVTTAVAGLTWVLATSGRQPSGKTDAEMARLRDEVERLSDEVARVAEAQAYMTRLLADGEQRGSLPKPEIRDADA